MAGLSFLGGAALRHTTSLAAFGLSATLKPHEQECHLRAASAAAVVAACDGLGVELTGVSGGGALSTTLAATKPPRTQNHTRRLVVPAYCLAGTRTRRRRGRRASGGDDDDLFGGGGDDGGWGGDDGFWGGGGDGEEEGGHGSLAARLQDLLLLWSIFCGLAFCQSIYHVSPVKPKATPVFAALGYSGLKLQLSRQQQCAAC